MARHDRYGQRRVFRCLDPTSTPKGGFLALSPEQRTVDRMGCAFSGVRSHRTAGLPGSHEHSGRAQKLRGTSNPTPERSRQPEFITRLARIAVMT
jgi:hypothetical protein